MRKTAHERFMAKVSVSDDGCWIWAGAKNKDGYGSFWNGQWRDGDTSRPVMVLAHRWSFLFIAWKAIPEGMYVLHTCDRPDCVNPAHLWTGTQKDNVADCALKGRRNQARRVFRKLDAERHSLIAEEYARGGVSQKELGARHGISQTMVSHIVSRARG